MILLPPGTLGRLQTAAFTHYRRTLLRRCRRDAGPSPTASCLVLAPYPALLNLKQCCADVRAFEIRILASSIEKQLVLDAFMQI
jgi:hypothetical protein